MGSLEEIGGYLQDISNIHLGIINNVSTQMALEVGSGILRHAELEEILKNACENIQITYRAINTQKKEPVILFTSEMGLHAAERMQELLEIICPDMEKFVWCFVILVHCCKNRISMSGLKSIKCFV